MRFSLVWLCGPVSTKQQYQRKSVLILSLWLQCFRNGIGITVIEARGATIRDGKHRSFDLITPYKTFRLVISPQLCRDYGEILMVTADSLSFFPQLHG